MEQYCYHCMNKLDGFLPCPECGWSGKSEAEPHQLPPGTILQDQYLLGEVLGQGGFGITYIGRDLSQNRRIAVKEYYPGNCAIRDASVTSMITVSGSRQEKILSDGKDKMLQEAKVLQQLNNVSGIVDVYDYFEENNTVYIVMEYLEGSDLRTILNAHTISAEELFQKIVPLMQSLSEVHSRHLIHRDISPDNIMMLKDGSLKLMDFGAARESNDQDDHSISVILKSGYAPVEQYSEKGTQGPWTDIYALCATMYKCITGKTPEESLQRLLQDNVLWPSELGCKITSQQEAILKRGMAVKKEDRYPDLSSLLTDLQLADPDETLSKEDDVTIPMPHDPYRFPPGHEPKKNKKKPIIKLRQILIVLGILVVLVGGGVLGYRMSPSYTEHLMQTGEMIHVALAPEAGYEDAFDNNITILKNRLDIFAGKRKYRLKMHGRNSLDLYLPIKAFGESDPDDVLSCFLASEGRMYLADRTYEETQLDPLEIKPSYIDHIDTAYGSVSGFSVSEEIWEDPEYEYLTIHLNKEGRKKLGKYQPENAIISMDVLDRSTLSGSRYQVFYSYFEQDVFPDPMYIMNTDKKRAFPAYLPLMEFLLTHEPMEGHLEYVVENTVRWESSTDEYAGSNQRAESELPESSITLILRNIGESVTEGSRLDAMDLIKKRCDALSVPYAFGSLKEDKNSFAVKIGPEHVNRGILNLIPVYRANPLLLIGNSRLDIPWENIKIEENNGQYGVRITIEEEDKTSIDRLMQEDPSLLCFFTLQEYGIPLLQDMLEKSYDGESFLLMHSGCDNKILTVSEYSWLTDFLMSLSETSSSNLIGYQAELQSDPLSVQPDWPYGLPEYDCDYVSELEERIQDLVPGSEVIAGNEPSDNMACLTVKLHLDLDEKLPEKALSIAQEIYEISNMNHSMFESINIYPTDTKPRTKERMSIRFQRYMSKDLSLPNVDVVSGRCFGGRLEQYQNEFRRLLTQNEFYRQLGKNYQQYQSIDGSSGWVFGTVIYF